MPRFSLDEVAPFTPEEIARLKATTEEEIQRHIIEDGDIDLGDCEALVLCPALPKAIR